MRGYDGIWNGWTRRKGKKGSVEECGMKGERKNNNNKREEGVNQSL